MAKTETLYEKLRSEGEQAEQQHPTGARHNKIISGRKGGRLTL